MDYHMQFLNFFLFSKNMDCYMQFLYIPTKTWTIICNFWNFFPFSKNLEYNMQFLNFFLFSKNMDYHMQFQEFLYFLQKRGLSYAFYGISFPPPKTLTIICNI